MAEKKGFEPLIPLWGIHDFQSCALDQLRDFSVSVENKKIFSFAQSQNIIMQKRRKVKREFSGFTGHKKGGSDD